MATAPEFSRGDKVRVKMRVCPGHLRTPAYLRGHCGRIERALGVFSNPEELAYGRRGDERRLYRVRFSVKDLWVSPENAQDTVDAEIYEHWLEPVV